MDHRRQSMENTYAFRKAAALMIAVILTFAALLTAASVPAYAAARPAKVTGVKAAARSNYSIRVSWKKAGSAKKYQIYRSNKKNGKYKIVSTVSGTSFTNSDLKKGTKYFFKVRAVNGSKKGSFSAVKSASTKKSKLYDVAVNKNAGTVTVSARVNGKYFSNSTRHLMVDQYGFNKGTAMLSSYCTPDDLYNGLVSAGAVSWSKSAGKSLKNGEKNTVSNAERRNFSKLDVSLSWDNETHSLDECLTTEKGGSKAPEIDMIFSGNPGAAAKTPSGCMVCMDSCYIGMVANSAYGLCVIDKGEPSLYARSDVMPANGKVVKVTFTIK